MAKQQTDAQAEIDIARLQVEYANMEAWIRAFEGDFRDFKRDQHDHNEVVTSQLHEIGLAVAKLEPRSIPENARVQQANTLLNLAEQWSGRGAKVILLLVALWTLKIVSFDVDLAKFNAALEVYSKLGKAGLLPDATPTGPSKEPLAGPP